MRYFFFLLFFNSVITPLWISLIFDLVLVLFCDIIFFYESSYRRVLPKRTHVSTILFLILIFFLFFHSLFLSQRRHFLSLCGNSLHYHMRVGVDVCHFNSFRGR